MKNLKPLYFLIITLLSLAACSKDSFNEPSDPADEPTNPQEKIYLSLGLSNEIAIDSRAYADDYVVTENQIVNGKVFIYDATGKTESEAVCVASGILVKEGETLTPGKNDLPNEFSTKPIKFKNVELTSFDFDETHDYYALVILNANEKDQPFFEFPSISDKQTFGTWALKPQSSKMVIDVDEKPTWRKYITMTNATGHIGWKEGEVFKPATLVPIKREDLKKGKFDEDHTPSTTIYVQRNTAKVVVKPKDNITGEDKLFTVGPFTLQLNIENWKLHVVNNTSYPVMNIEDLTWEKSYSTSGSSTFNRVYWCKDPNYDDPSTDLKNNSIGIPMQVGSGDPLYPLENTFSTKCMLQGQTTRAIIRCKIDPNPYKQNERWDKYKLPANYENNNNLNVGVFKIGEGNEETLWDKQHIEETLKNEAQKLYVEGLSPEISWKIPFEKWSGNDGGIKPLSEILSIKIGEDELTGEQLDLLAKSLKLTDAKSPEISFYENGWCYYVVRIRHYNEKEAKDGEESVAWDESMSKVINGKSVADYKSRHLGRYGIVRNNYYVITVNSLHNLGSPSMIPEINNDDTDDMPNDYFIDVTVNVKKWGLRETSFDF